MLMKLKDPHSDTTRSWQVPGYKGRVGFISSMSDHFCGECSRLRVGADGGVKVSRSLALLSRCFSSTLPLTHSCPHLHIFSSNPHLHIFSSTTPPLYHPQVCLFGPPVLALRPLLRSSTTSDANMMQEIGQAVWGKKWAHNGLGGASGIARDGKMGAMVGIGG